MTELVKLNDKWRIDDDPLQWILKRRVGTETYAADGSVVKPARWVGRHRKLSGWASCAFLTTSFLGTGNPSVVRYAIPATLTPFLRKRSEL